MMSRADSATPETSRFKDVFSALDHVGVDAQPVVYEDDVLDAVRTQLATFDGVLVWVNPIHEGRNRAKLDALLREMSASGVWVSAHPDVILKMGTKEVLHRTRMMSWGCDTALYRTAEAMRAELPSRLAAGPRVIKRNRGNGGQGVWKVETLASSRKRPMLRVLDATKKSSQELALDEFLERCVEYFEDGCVSISHSNRAWGKVSCAATWQAIAAPVSVIRRSRLCSKHRPPVLRPDRGFTLSTPTRASNVCAD